MTKEQEAAAKELEALECDCIDHDAWVCWRGQNIKGMNECPCVCHSLHDALRDTQEESR